MGVLFPEPDGIPTWYSFIGNMSIAGLASRKDPQASGTEYYVALPPA